MSKQRGAAIFFGAIVVIAVIVTAATSGIGHDSVPKDAVAVVDGKPISRTDFDRALQQVELQSQTTTPPAPGTAQYDQVRDQALGQLLDQAWIEGEAASQGVTASDREIADKLAQTKKQQFKTEAEYQSYIKKAGFTPEDVNERIRLSILGDKLQSKIQEGVPQVSNSEAQDFYDQNKSQFSQPASRDIRVVLNKDPAKIAEAEKLLKADSSDANWKKVAAKYSTDAATKNTGGVRTAVTQGTLEGDLDKDVFSAPLNTIEGPVTTSLGTYVFEVTKDTPASTQPFSAVSQQLIQELQGQKQQEVFSGFLQDYQDHWANLTICADGFVIDRCENYNGPAGQQTGQAPCTATQAKTSGCPPVVTERSPFAPGKNSLIDTASSQGGSPQRPHPPGKDQAAPAGGAAPGGIGAAGATGAAGGSTVPVSPQG